MNSDFGSDGMNMKRSASNEMLSVEDDGNGNTKRRRSSSGRTVDARFLLQSKNAGAIIGKGGANINRLRKDFKASVTVPDCPGPERILTIVADIETVGDILTDIIPKLEDYAHHRTTSFECEMRMLMHQSHAGCVIGRGGQRIKELREKTGAQIKVYSNVCPESTERVAQITGFPNVVVDCVKEICELITQSPIKGPSQNYDPHNYSMIYAHEYGGYGEGGARGRGGPGSGGGGNLNRPPRPPMSGGGSGPGMFGGSGYGRGSGSMGRQDHPPPFNTSMAPGGNMGGDGPPVWRGMENNNYGMPPPPPPPGGMQRAGGIGGGPNRGPPLMGLNQGGPNMVCNNAGGGGGIMSPLGDPMAPKWEADQTDFYENDVDSSSFSFSLGLNDWNKPPGEMKQGGPTQITIPNEVAGAVIGKGGQRIRKIRRDSGAEITIEDSKTGSKDRTITITGNSQQIQMAEFLLQKSIRENSTPGRRF